MQGKTTTIGLLKRIPNDYKACPPSVSTLELELMQNDQVVLLKNEYGDVEGNPSTSHSHLDHRS